MHNDERGGGESAPERESCSPAPACRQCVVATRRALRTIPRYEGTSVHNTLYKALYQRTLSQQKLYRDEGYRVFVVWEHEYETTTTQPSALGTSSTWCGRCERVHGGIQETLGPAFLVGLASHLFPPCRRPSACSP